MADIPLGSHVTVINSLPPLAPTGGGGGVGDATLLAHILSPTPHPTYDTIPDLSLLFRAALI